MMAKKTRKTSQNRDSILLSDKLLREPGFTLLDVAICGAIAADRTGTNKTIGARINIHHRDIANRLRSLLQREFIKDVTTDRMEIERVFKLSEKTSQLMSTDVNKNRQV